MREEMQLADLHVFAGGTMRTSPSAGFIVFVTQVDLFADKLSNLVLLSLLESLQISPPEDGVACFAVNVCDGVEACD